MSYLTTPATFNGDSLPDLVPGLTILSFDPYKLPVRDLSISDIVRSNRSVHNSGFYKEKNITLRVGITRATRALLEASIDTLMAILQPLNKPLIIQQSGTSRKYFCSLSDAPVENDGGSYIEISLVFTLTDRFGYDITPTNLLDISSAYTSSTRSDRFFVEGSAPTQALIFSLTFGSITSGSGQSVMLGNSNTGQQVTVNRNWLSGDVLLITPAYGIVEKSVKVNNTEVAFTGAVPEFAKGFQYWNYQDTFQARSFTGSIDYYKRYV
jgi:hypothetical protein